MPELPDVEVFKRYLERRALHQRIAQTSVKSRDILRQLSAAKLKNLLNGRELNSSHRHGKFLFVAFDGTGWLVLHFGMTGFLKYFKDPADTPSHTRVLIGFENGYQLAYDCKRKLGELNLSDSIEAFIQQRKLGPDALDLRFDLSAFSTILSRTRSPVKSALMNQRVIAGIGNVYSDEILFHAGIHPGSRSDRLPDKAGRKTFPRHENELEKRGKVSRRSKALSELILASPPRARRTVSAVPPSARAARRVRPVPSIRKRPSGNVLPVACHAAISRRFCPTSSSTAR